MFTIQTQCGHCQQTHFLASRVDKESAVRTAKEFENRHTYVEVRDPKGKGIYPLFKNGTFDNPFK